MKILYICNNSTLVEHLYDHVKNSKDEYIYLLDEPFLEDEKIIHGTYNLFPFSVWKFIIQNNIFEEEDYLCIVEYNGTPLKNMVCNPEYDIISFQETSKSFYDGVNRDKLDNYLKEHNLEVPDVWWPSMYHCIRRSLMHEFVNFYSYTCNDIDDIDYLDYSSRILSAYSKSWKRLVLKKDYALCYDSDETTRQLIECINYYTPHIEVICCSPEDAPTGYWKPYIIYQMITTLEEPSTLLYLGNSYCFNQTHSTIYENLSLIKAWKSPNTIHPEHLEQILQGYHIPIIKTMDLFTTEIILFETKPETIKIIKQWLDLCQHFSSQPLAKEIPDYVDIFFSILMRLYTM